MLPFLLTQWQQVKNATNDDVLALISHDVPALLWGIEEFALHAGQEDHDAGLARGLNDDQYYEQPPARKFDAEKTEFLRRRELRDVAYNLLPAGLRQNPAQRERSQYYLWLRLTPRGFRFETPAEIDAMEESLDARFLRLVTHPDLRPMRMDALVIEMIPPLVKRQWIEFARKLEMYLLDSSEDVDDILNQKPDKNAARADRDHDPAPRSPKPATKGRTR